MLKKKWLKKKKNPTKALLIIPVDKMYFADRQSCHICEEALYIMTGCVIAHLFIRTCRFALLKNTKKAVNARESCEVSFTLGGDKLFSYLLQANDLSAFFFLISN